MTKNNKRETVHSHNLLTSDQQDHPFGLRLSLPAGDTFDGILGSGWQKERWFRSEAERDRAIYELRKQHPYYRLGDRPTLEIAKINRPGPPSGGN